MVPLGKEIWANRITVVKGDCLFQQKTVAKKAEQNIVLILFLLSTRVLY